MSQVTCTNPKLCATLGRIMSEIGPGNTIDVTDVSYVIEGCKNGSSDYVKRLIDEGYEIPIDVLRYITCEDMVGVILSARPYVSLKYLRTSYLSLDVVRYIDSEGRNSLFYIDSKDIAEAISLGASSEILDKYGETFVQYRNIGPYTPIVDCAHIAALISVDALIESKHVYHMPVLYRIYPEKVFCYLMKVDKGLLSTMDLMFADHPERLCRNSSPYEEIRTRISNKMPMNNEQCDLAVTFMDNCYNEIAMLAINKDHVLDIIMRRMSRLICLDTDRYTVYTGMHQSDEDWLAPKDYEQLSYKEFDEGVRGVLNALKTIQYKSERMFEECAYRGIYLSYITIDMMGKYKDLSPVVARRCASETFRQYISCGFVLPEDVFTFNDWNELDEKVKIVCDMHKMGITCYAEPRDMLKLSRDSAVSFANVAESYHVSPAEAKSIVRGLYPCEDVRRYIRAMEKM